ncbi:hypothetical protein [Deinococcus sp. QL22]|uniref:hypothetical protein n=1 Tax=Deinococcus sp. QL22 TaxID=2939437 RepID=UPI0020174E7B|nr:hypothetical protein [Deinococcus sp. QL22]UQN09811.1 hypothetical protein M1R55_25435 [Deinococcus sp. QL22]
MQSTLSLWQQLKAGGHLEAVRVVISKAPPIGRVSHEARDALRAAGVACPSIRW